MKKRILILIALLALLITPVYASPIQKATLINDDGTKKVVTVGSMESNFYTGKLGYHLMTGLLGATVYQTPALFETSLASAIGKTDTSMTLVSGTTMDGNILSGNYCFTIDSGLNTAEYVCGAASSTAVTGLIRGIGSDGVTTVATLEFSHRYGANVKITDFPVLQQFGRIINGTDSFPNVLEYNSSVSSTTSFTNDQQIVSKGYVNSIAYGSAPVAQEGTKGIVDLATQAQMASGSSSGAGGSKLVLQSKYASSTSPSTTTIPVTNTSGKLDTSFIDQTAAYTWSGTNTFSGIHNITGTTTFSNLVKVPTSTPTVAGQVIGLDTNSKLPAINGSQLLYVPTADASIASSSLSAYNNSGTITSITATSTMPADANYALVTGYLTVLNNNSVYYTSYFSFLINRSGTFTTSSCGATNVGDISGLARMDFSASVSAGILSLSGAGPSASSNSHSYTLSGIAYFFR